MPGAWQWVVGVEGGAEGGVEELDLREFVGTSLKALALDLALQLSITIGIYVATYDGLAAGYQIAALQSSLPSYGTAWVIGWR